MRASIFTRLDEFLALNLSSIKLITIGFPVLLGVGMGFLISRGMWIYAVIMAVLIPIAIVITKRPFIGVVVYLLLMPLLSALPNADMMYQMIHRILLPLTLTAVLVSYLIKASKFLPIRLGPPELALCILAVYVPISLIYLQLNIQAPLRDYIDRMLIPMCMYFILRITPLDKKDITYLQWTAFFIALCQCTLVFIELIIPQILPIAWQPNYSERAAGSLVNPYVLADVLIFSICILLHTAMNQKSGLSRILFLVICGLSTISIFLTMERAVWLASSFVFIGLFVLFPRSMFRVSLILGIVIILLWGGFLAPKFSAAAERIGQLQQVYDRVVASDAMLQMIQIKPVFGWGYDTLNDNIRQFYRTVGNASISYGFVTSHNTYLTILTELGLIGVLLYLFPIIWWFINSVLVWTQLTKDGTWNPSLLIICWLVILNSIILSNFADMRFFPFDQTLLWMMVGLIANMVDPLKQRIKFQHGRV